MGSLRSRNRARLGTLNAAAIVEQASSLPEARRQDACATTRFMESVHFQEWTRMGTTNRRVRVGQAFQPAGCGTFLSRVRGSGAKNVA